MAGHVFVVRGDLRRLACDAWLLPCDVGLNVNPVWWRKAPDAVERALERVSEIALPLGWSNVDVRVCCLSGGDDQDGPQIWLANTGADDLESPEWYARGVRQFVTDALAALPPRDVPRRVLLGLPLVGTGEGGQASTKTPVVRRLLEEAGDLAHELGVDLVLVVHDRRDFAAVQRMRDDMRRGSSLGPELGAVVADLATKAREGTLVIFFGAGVSAAAGLPTWSKLLDALGVNAGIDEIERNLLAQLPELDRARVIEARLGAKGLALAAEIDGIFAGSEPVSLAHMQLASLPVTEFMTTNYDTRFESACELGDPGECLAVIPYEPAAGATRRLLKMHGTVSPARDIVLTREEYLRFGERRGALAGIVQALLITRHMLFVGFSLADDNFHRIASDVRKALGAHERDGQQLFGTALNVGGHGFADELWGQDLKIVELGADVLEAARVQDILLDEVLLHSSSAVGHLLDPTYEGMLSVGEKAVRDALHILSEAAQGTVTEKAVARLAREFGAPA